MASTTFELLFLLVLKYIHFQPGTDTMNLSMIPLYVQSCIMSSFYRTGFQNCSNPDQSKHLETARMRLYDIWIDVVNLRCEDYSENSRIPTMVLSFFIDYTVYRFVLLMCMYLACGVLNFVL